MNHVFSYNPSVITPSGLSIGGLYCVYDLQLEFSMDTGSKLDRCLGRADALVVAIHPGATDSV